MEWDGKVGSPQAQCAASGRPLAPGEQVFGVLVQREGGFARLDVGAESWEAFPRDGVLSWWRRIVPEPERRVGRVRLDPDVLWRIFHDLADAEDAPRRAFRYIVALCLVRARRLSLEGIEKDAAGAWLMLAERGGDARHRLADPLLRPEDEASLSEQLLAVAAQT